jgi:putative polyhydroxyalkanoate system protein
MGQGVKWYGDSNGEPMASIVVRRHHDLGIAKAKKLAQSIARKLKNDFGGSYEWHGDVLRFKRTGASGSLAVRDDSVRVHVDLGLLLRPLRSRIEREITSFLDEHMGERERKTGDGPARRTARRRKAS